MNVYLDSKDLITFRLHPLLGLVSENTVLTEEGNPIYSSVLFHLCLRRKLPRQIKYGR